MWRTASLALAIALWSLPGAAEKKKSRPVPTSIAAVAVSEESASLRALAKTGTTDAYRTMVKDAAEGPLAVRNEAADLIALAGDKAVPALILDWRGGSTPAIRRLAGTTLEMMEKQMPGEAIQTKSQELLAEVLRAYGTVKDPDALGVVLSFANADREVPREAARAAIVDYGGVALGKLREAYASFMNRPSPEEWMPDRIARELFVAYDRDRRREMYVLFDEGVALQKRAQETTPPDPALLEKAVEAFDKILARAPAIERRSEMVPAYVLLAQARTKDAPDRAAQLYRKAQHLDPNSPRAAQIESGLLALEAKSLRERGVIDEESLRRALALDPANPLAHAELERLEESRGAHAHKLSLVGWIGGAVAAVGIALLGLFALRRRLAG